MKYLATCLCLATLMACSTKDEVLEIDSSFASFVEITCGDAQFSQEQYDNIFSNFPDVDRIPIYTELTEKHLRCEALKPIQASLIEGNAQLAEGQILPSERYTFDFSISANDIRRVGYFSSEDKCKAARDTIVSMGLKAEACAE